MSEYNYLVIYERAESNWAAYSPDVPGCVSTGATQAEAASNFREALLFHLEGLQEDGLPIPEALAVTDRVKVAV